MKKSSQVRFAALAAVAISASIANAQAQFGPDARNDKPWMLGIGGYFPTVTHTNNSYGIGPELLAGLRYAGQGFDLVVSTHARAYFSNDNESLGRVQIGVISLDAFARADRFYFGPGIGTASSTASFTFDGEGNTTDNFGAAVWQTVWSMTAGVDITPESFIEARWQNSRVAGYQGYSVYLGFRF